MRTAFMHCKRFREVACEVCSKGADELSPRTVNSSPTSPSKVTAHPALKRPSTVPPPLRLPPLISTAVDAGAEGSTRMAPVEQRLVVARASVWRRGAVTRTWPLLHSEREP